MDLLEHLTQEHRKAESMLSTLAQSEEGAERESTVEELTTALQTHMAVEERFLYPIVKKTLGEETEDEAESEHTLARDGLQKLNELVAEPGFGAAVDMLVAGIGHHVQEEENEIFPQLRQKAADQIAALDPEQLEQEVKSSGASRGGTDLTKEELYEKAKQAEVPGRSSMSKDELANAVQSSDS